MRGKEGGSRGVGCARKEGPYEKGGKERVDGRKTPLSQLSRGKGRDEPFLCFMWH